MEEVLGIRLFVRPPGTVDDNQGSVLLRLPLLPSSPVMAKNGRWKKKKLQLATSRNIQEKKSSWKSQRIRLWTEKLVTNKLYTKKSRGMTEGRRYCILSSSAVGAAGLHLYEY